MKEKKNEVMEATIETVEEAVETVETKVEEARMTVFGKLDRKILDAQDKRAEKKAKKAEAKAAKKAEKEEASKEKADSGKVIKGVAVATGVIAVLGCAAKLVLDRAGGAADEDAIYELTDGEAEDKLENTLDEFSEDSSETSEL